ncbi:c-type cytochrome [Membranihabitans marinus]
MMGCTNQSSIEYFGTSVPPENAVASYELADGFQMELFACEPIIADPVDMAVDAWGKMYVVEMSGYPTDNSHTGKIKLLADEDGDGIMDKSILFADGLMFPNGLMPWKNGIMVTDAPYVFYFEDEDGDGQADRRDTVLSGFSLSNPHVNVNNPIYGLDNWVYLSHFGRLGTKKYEEFNGEGSEISFWKKEQSATLPKNANSKTVRFKVDDNQLEMMSMKGQFGHSFDEWGHHFLNHNQNHIYHEVLGPKYLNRNPDVIITNAAQDVSDHGNFTEIFQITTHPDRQLFTPMGVSTSSSGLTYYGGGLFPPPYDKNVTFGAESVSNLVHVDKIHAKGASFTGQRIEEDQEFLASKDSWARPVNMYVGPDGALYVLDYYRRIIEHPEWMSEEAIAEGGLYDGHTMGRIYRITPTGSPAAEWTKGLDLGSADGGQLIAYLSHKNQWWRMMAQQLLVTQKDVSIKGDLVDLVENGSVELGRLHGLWTLEGLGLLNDEVLKTALQDLGPGVRENAVLLAESRMSESDEWESILVGMSEDTSEKVRFRILAALGNSDSEISKKTRNRLLLENMSDPWVQQMALTAVDLDAEKLMRDIIAQNKMTDPNYNSMTQRLGAMVGARGDQTVIKKWIKRGLSEKGSLQTALMSGLTSGIQRNKDKKSIVESMDESLMTAYFNQSDIEVQHQILQLLDMVELTNNPQFQRSLDRAMTLAKDKNLSGKERGQYLQFLILTDPLPYVEDLEKMIVPSEEVDVQKSALEIYSRVEGTMGAQYVLDHWTSLTVGLRDVAINIFMKDDAGVMLLLDAFETKKISPDELGYRRSVRLNQYRDEEIRKRARAILTADQSAEVIQSYRASLDLDGDEKAGFEVFKANCSICHQVRGKSGVSYGPDLGTVHNWKAEDLLANILNPSLSIAPGFDMWEVEVNNGEPLLGIIINETSTAIELKMGPSEQQTINRQEIKSIRVIPSMSLMPSFANQLEMQELADLIAFLRNSQS